MFRAKVLPSSLYTDRGSHYFHTPDAGGKEDKSKPTQVGGALHQLGIEHIAAYSPQARGRSERAFGTPIVFLFADVSRTDVIPILLAPLARSIR